MTKLTKKILLFITIFVILAPLSFLHSDAPDYYTGLGSDYNINYYSYFVYDKFEKSYAFVDELPVVNLEYGTFYKTISEKKSGRKIVGAFYLKGKLKWAVTYDGDENIIRVEKHNLNGEIVSDKYYNKKGELFFESEVGEFDIYTPKHNKKPEGNIEHIFTYFTKGQGLEISDRRDITKWYDKGNKKKVLRLRYYNPSKKIMFKESVYNTNNDHIYDRNYYYDGSGKKIQYAEYYADEKLVETAFYQYSGNDPSEIEYRGKDDDGIVREIYEGGKKKQTIVYYKYYLEELILDYDKNERPMSAVQCKYGSGFKLLKKHTYDFKNGQFNSESIEDAMGNVIEEVKYDYNKNKLGSMTINGIREGNKYNISVNYKYDKNGKVSGASVGGDQSGSISYKYDSQGEILDVNIKAGSQSMTYYTVDGGDIRVDVLGPSGKWEIYDKEEKVIGMKEKHGDSVITISNDGVISRYETPMDDGIQVIHFDNGKPSQLETLSLKDRKPLYREFFDEAGKKIKSVSFDPDNYKESFTEYDENGKIISEYNLNSEGSLIAKLFYDEEERPSVYEEYNTFGVVTFYSIRTYNEDTGKLYNYSSYKNFRNDGFKLQSVQLYGDGDLPETVFVFDDLSHQVTTAQFNSPEGEKEKFIWRNITGIRVNEEHHNYAKKAVKKINYTRTKLDRPASNELVYKDFYSKIK